MVGCVYGSKTVKDIYVAICVGPQDKKEREEKIPISWLCLQEADADPLVENRSEDGCICPGLGGSTGKRQAHPRIKLLQTTWSKSPIYSRGCLRKWIQSEGRHFGIINAIRHRQNNFSNWIFSQSSLSVDSLEPHNGQTISYAWTDRNAEQDHVKHKCSPLLMNEINSECLVWLQWELKGKLLGEVLLPSHDKAATFHEWIAAWTSSAEQLLCLLF